MALVMHNWGWRQFKAGAGKIIGPGQKYEGFTLRTVHDCLVLVEHSGVTPYELFSGEGQIFTTGENPVAVVDGEQQHKLVKFFFEQKQLLGKFASTDVVLDGARVCCPLTGAAHPLVFRAHVDLGIALRHPITIAEVGLRHFR
ncbi:MAG: hypothetical protein A2542_01380 [Parcubacteria group bacterium RIFOXYD2_FULL_52_8]|nr:MAG: hypothetical protein A2542_01380 [Parcubacteria group bacterium RIFOXYD2_FULL_52_8]